MTQSEQLLKTTGLMDFDDMIYWVCHWDLRLWQNDWVFVDEAQDLSPMQRMVVSKVLNWNRGFIVIVGDIFQAIYRFTGADSDSFQRTVNWFKADVLPLSVTRRCDKIIAHHAQQTVEAFTPLDSKGRGKFIWLPDDQFVNHVQPGDMVICRVKAPLISKAIECIAKEMPAMILGGNIGTALIDLMEKISKRDGFQWSKAQEAVASYRFVRVNYFLSKDDEPSADNVRDDCDAITVLLENSQAMSLPMFGDYVNQLFADDSENGKVILCTGHKSKGLEADRVFILQPEKMPMIRLDMHPESIQQEKNLQYVAWTRAKHELVYLTNKNFLEGQGKNPPSYVQYDFDEHSWTDDGLYMLDDDGHTAIQMPSGGLVKKDRPEEEPETQLVVVGAEENIIEVPSDESAELDINIADDDSTLIRTIEEKPLTAEEADQIGFATDISNDIVEDTDSPADESLMPLEFPSDPVAWAQYVLEHKDRIVVLDTETTTWSNDPACEVVQLGIADMDGHQLLNVRIKPSKGSVSDGAARIHGITNTMLKDEKTLPHYLEQIRNAIQGKYIIAYNAPFDKEALARAFTNADLDPISVAGWQCAMRTYARHNPNKLSRGRKGGWWKLVEAVEQQRMTAREDAHDALADVLMTIDLIQSMAQDSAHRWKNKVGYIPGDLVAVKATEVHFEIVKTMPNGELNMRDVQDASYQTMAASMIKLITRVQDRPALTEPLEPETLILEADSQVDESDSTLTEPEVVTIQPIQKSANPLATDKFERMIAGMGSREEALMLIEYITAVIDHVHPEPA